MKKRKKDRKEEKKKEKKTKKNILEEYQKKNYKWTQTKKEDSYNKNTNYPIEENSEKDNTMKIWKKKWLNQPN